MKIRRAALSRIDLLVVIVIIVLVPSILTASLEAARELAKIPVCANQLRQIGCAVSLYAERYDGFMPWWGYDAATAEDPYAGNEEMHPYVAYRLDSAWVYPTTGKPKPMRLACLYEGGLITDPKIFYCPANKNSLYMYESYIDPPPWGKLPQKFNTGPPARNQWVRLGYIYYPTDPNYETFASSVFPGLIVPKYVARRLDNLDPNIPYLTDMLLRRSYIPHNIQDTLGVNALFKDGRVVYCDDPAVFADSVWQSWEYTSGSASWWRDFYYMVFKQIGQSCGPAE